MHVNSIAKKDLKREGLVWYHLDQTRDKLKPISQCNPMNLDEDLGYFSGADVHLFPSIDDKQWKVNNYGFSGSSKQ